MNNEAEKRRARKYARDRLTADEQTTLELIADGKTNDEIAELTFVSVHTVKSRVVRLLSLLDVNNRAELVAAAYKRHMIGPPDSATLQKEIAELKAKLAGVSNKNRELAMKNTALQGQLEILADQNRKLMELNRQIGNQSTAWLDTGQGRL